MDRRPTPWPTINGELVVGGDFTYINGPKSTASPAGTDRSWLPLGRRRQRREGRHQVKALVAYKGELMAGGNFTTAGGVDCQTHRPLERDHLGGVGRRLQRPGPCPDHLQGRTDRRRQIHRLRRDDSERHRPMGRHRLVAARHRRQRNLEPRRIRPGRFGGELYAGGLFTRPASVTVNHIARWDGAEWHAMADGMAGSGYPGCPGRGPDRLQRRVDRRRAVHQCRRGNGRQHRQAGTARNGPPCRARRIAARARSML